MFSCALKESKGVDEDGDQEHRSHRKVLQRQNHHRVRNRGVGGGANRLEDPSAKRAERGHRRDSQSSEENVRLFHDQMPSCLQCLYCSSVPSTFKSDVTELFSNF